MSIAEASPPAVSRLAPLSEIFACPRPAPPPPARAWRSAAVSLALHLAALVPLAFLIHSAPAPARLDAMTIEADLDLPFDLFDTPGEDANTRVLTTEKLERPPAEDAAPRAADPAEPNKALGAELADAVRADAGTGGMAAAGPLGGNPGETGAGGAGAGDGVAFAKLSAKGKRFVFCIDRSASMREHDAIEFAKRELIASIDKLQPHMEFQVVFYNEGAVALETGAPKRRKELLPASAPNRVRAINAVRDAAVEGGTNHKAALTMALDLRPDAIFLLTDAEDEPRDIDDLVAWLTAQNRRRREVGDSASVHVVQFWHDASKPPQAAIKELAQQNRGSFRLVEADKLELERPESEPSR